MVHFQNLKHRIQNWRIKRLEQRVVRLNELINGLNPRLWPDVYDEAWDDRALLLRRIDQLKETV